ncbi:MAG: helix-turn-helix transcriptional regulator [Lentisphaeria bacterium]|nr:helix-turn-helix transcriptional regulator [Lentisphaeria bacterium]
MDIAQFEKPISLHLCGYDFDCASEFISYMHRHPFYQLNLVFAGYAEMENSRGRVTISAGDAILTPPGECHSLRFENSCDFKDYSFKFFINAPLQGNVEHSILSSEESRTQQLVWINAIGEIFRSIAPPELFFTTKEFPIDSTTPGVDMLEQLIWGFCRRIINGKNSAEPWLIRKIKTIIRTRGGAPVSVEECAKALKCSSGHLLAMIRKTSGISTKELIDRERIKIAMDFLAYSDISISDLAQKMGFKDLIYFDKFFKKYAAETPRNYRKRHKDISEL